MILELVLSEFNGHFVLSRLLRHILHTAFSVYVIHNFRLGSRWSTHLQAHSSFTGSL